jgi:hypothetical protein
MHACNLFANDLLICKSCKSKLEAFPFFVSSCFTTAAAAAAAAATLQACHLPLPDPRQAALAGAE